MSWRNGGILNAGVLWHTAWMERHFLDHVKQTIRNSRSLSVAGLGERLGKSESQTYRILRGEAPYHVRYTAILREYVGLGSPIDRAGLPTVAVDWVDLRLPESMNREADVICRTNLPQGWLPVDADPAALKLIEIMDNHCAPDYAKGEHAFIDSQSTMPEPSGHFLIWTGIGFRVQHLAYVVGTQPAEVILTSTCPSKTVPSVQCPLQQLSVLGRLIGKIVFSD